MIALTTRYPHLRFKVDGDAPRDAARDAVNMGLLSGDEIRMFHKGKRYVFTWNGSEVLIKTVQRGSNQ